MPGKKKTTFTKLARERKLRERRLDKQAKKDARKLGTTQHAETGELLTGDTGELLTGELAQTGKPPAQDDR